MKTVSRALRLVRHFKILFLSFVCLFLFFSCADITSGYVYEKTDTSRYVYISLENAKSIVTARTITAPSVDFTDSSKNYCFYIWGKSSLGSVTPRLVDFNSETGTTGTINLDFPVTSYFFTLAVTEGEIANATTGKIIDKAILIGYSNADLTYTNTVRFCLADNEIYGTGAVNLSIYLDDSWSAAQIDDLNTNYFVTFGLYYIKSGNIISGYTPTNMDGSLSKTVPFTTNGYLSGVEAGVYNFTVKIQKKTGGSIYSYSDRIIVAANRTIDQSVYIPNVVERAPDAPSSFQAAYSMAPCIYYTYNGDTGISTRLKNDDVELDLDDYNVNGYGLLLKWADSSKNESGFKITLANITKIINTEAGVISAIAALPDTMTDSSWRTIVGSYEDNSNYVTVLNVDDYVSSPMYVAGSLERNSTQLILYVPFGECYIAKIQSVNDAGESAATYVTMGENFTVVDENDTDYNIGARYEGSAFMIDSSTASKVINRYKVVYYLNGGKFEYRHNGDVKISPENRDFAIEYHTCGDGKILCPTKTLDSATADDQALVYLATDAPDENEAYYTAWRTWFDENCGWNINDRWKRWTIGSIYGSTYPSVSNDDGTGFTYQKPNDYTGYTSLYLFARYDD